VARSRRHIANGLAGSLGSRLTGVHVRFGGAGRLDARQAIVVDLDRMATTFDVVNAEGDGASSSVLAERLCELGQAGIVTHAGGGYTLTNQGKALLTLPLEGPRWTGPTSTPNSCSSQLPPRPRTGPAVRHRRSI
jgi:hypothetical protein